MYVDWTLYRLSIPLLRGWAGSRLPRFLRLPRLPNPLLRGGVDETQNPPKVEPDGRQRPEKEQSCGWGEAEDKNSLEFTDIAIVLVLILK